VSDLLASVKKAARWLALAHTLRHALHFATLLLLARWLAPEVFGLFGLIAVVSGTALVLAEVGLGAALIQREGLQADDLHTSFWTGLFAGAVLTAAVAAAAGPIAAFFEVPALELPLQVGSLTFLAMGALQVPGALLQRELDFRGLAAAEVSAQLGFSLCAVALAAKGFGIWSFVVARLVSDALHTGVAFRASGYRPRARFRRDSLRGLLGFGITIVALRSVNHLAANLDRLIIGKLAGAAALGLYGMAYQTIRIPEQHVSQSVKRLLFPAFSRLQGQPERLARHYLTLVGSVSLLAFPMAAGIALVYPDFVALCLPAAWEPTTPLVRVLALGGALYAVGGTIGLASWSVGRPDVDLRLACLRLVLLSVLLGGCARFGALGVACAVSVYAVVTFPVYLVAVERLLGVPPRALLLRLWPAVQASLLMAATVGPLRLWLASLGAGPGIRLLGCAILGSACYGGVLLLRRDPELRELLRLLRRRPVLGFR
jgi:PST family polysaccharide transporter